MSKISTDHLAREAIVYVRQSTQSQLRHNHESRRRQYGLTDLARSLGWNEPVVIDDDLGRSGDGTSRPGFERLLLAICEGRVGIVLSLEASRLARNGRDWHTLLEFCGLVGCLLGDEDGVYDPRMPNDRMLLGLLCGAPHKIPSTRLSEETEAGARALVEQRSLPNPVVLMIDEAHNARTHENESAIFAHLHEGHVSDIPVLPVLAGLGHLREHLGQPGIRLTRFSDERKSVHTIAAISDDEVRELFGGWLEHFHVAATDGEGARWADALVRDSQGWPMHTNHFLTSLAGQLLMPGRDPGRLASADLDAVRRRAAERRVDYYDTRYDNPLLQEREHEVAKTLAALRSTGPVKMKNMLDTIQTAFQYRDMADARGAFAVLRERGFLQRTPELDTRMSARGGRVYACPIPSLSSYAAACESPQHLAATRGDAALTERLLREDPSAVDLRDAMGRAPLHVAAECRWADVAEVLLAAGADPDAPDAAGVTTRDAWPEFDWPDPPPGSGQKQKRRRPGWQQKP